MSAEKFFWGESSAFLFEFCVLFAVQIVVSGAVCFDFVVCFCMVCGVFQHGLWCGSAWSSGFLSVC